MAKTRRTPPLAQQLWGRPKPPRRGTAVATQLRTAQQQRADAERRLRDRANTEVYCNHALAQLRTVVLEIANSLEDLERRARRQTR